MCGICGIAHADPARGVQRERVELMTEALVHRGPDDDGYFFDGPVGLGMRRLSIIDVDGGRQPIGNEDGSVVLVYNGEIYNYRALRRELQAAGHEFSTSSDTEVVVHAYEDEGPEALGRLRGMFGLALWDGQRRRLLLAVDRFGIKPLYYAASDGAIAFGSELKCVMQAGMTGVELDPEGLAQYFTFGYIPPPATIFTGVRKLAPGTLLTWSPERGAETSRYWEVPHDRPDIRRSDVQTKAELRSALVDAARAHLVSDVPVGALLSGGIDSAALVALISEAAPQQLHTFSIGFADREHNELDKARLVAARYGTDHHELVVEPQTVELLPLLAAHFGEPFADSSALPTYNVARLAREHVKVVVSGDGGDELFLGYTLFRGLKLSARAQALPASIRQLVRRAAQALPTTPNTAVNDRLALLGKRVADTMLEPELAFKSKIASPGLNAIAPLLSPELTQVLADSDPFEGIDSWLKHYEKTNGDHTLAPFVRAGFQTSLAGDMLVKVDRMSMANSLEVRVPFLDHVLAEHVSTIPIERRMPGGRLKGLLKDTLSDALPSQVLNGPKHGFAVPLAAWFRGDLDAYAREVLVSPDAKRRGLLDTAAIEAMLARHREGTGNLSTTIWSLLMFELWCREALD